MNTGKVVYIIDDDDGARESVCALVKSMGVIAVGYSSAEDFLTGFDPTSQGCVVTDLRMQGMSGIELRHEIKARGWKLSMILISAYVTVATTVEAMRGGMEFVLEKPYKDQELWDAIQRALRTQESERQKASRFQQLTIAFDVITVDEEAVLREVMTGKANKQVANWLGISIRTVEDRRRRIVDKTGLGSISEVIAAYSELQALKSTG